VTSRDSRKHGDPERETASAAIERASARANGLTMGFAIALESGSVF